MSSLINAYHVVVTSIGQNFIEDEGAIALASVFASSANALTHLE